MQTIALEAPAPRHWWDCDWTPGAPRRFGHQPHVAYSDGSYLGSVGGPPDVEACLNVRRAAERIGQLMERALVDFVILRYRFYRECYADYSAFACQAAVARDAGVSLERVSVIVAQTYVWVA